MLLGYCGHFLLPCPPPTTGVMDIYIYDNLPIPAYKSLHTTFLPFSVNPKDIFCHLLFCHHLFCADMISSLRLCKKQISPSHTWPHQLPNHPQVIDSENFYQPSAAGPQNSSLVFQEKVAAKASLFCSTCRQSFVHVQSLNRHKWKCQGLRMLVCPQCNYVTHRMDSYCIHMRTKHGVDDVPYFKNKAQKKFP